MEEEEAVLLSFPHGKEAMGLKQTNKNPVDYGLESAAEKKSFLIATVNPDNLPYVHQGRWQEKIMTKVRSKVTMKVVLEKEREKALRKSTS